MEALDHASVAARIGLLVTSLPMLLGVAFALRPNERWLTLMRPLSLASIFAAIANVFLGLVNALQALGSVEQGLDVRFAIIVLRDTAILPFAAFAFLTVAWLGVAIGMREHC